MMLFRRFGSLARTRSAAVCALCALTLSASAAEATHVRTRRAAQSAGVAEAHGKLSAMDAIGPRRSRRNTHPVSAEAPSKKNEGAAKNKKGATAKNRGNGKNERAGATTRRRRRQREIEVEQPIPLSQAALQREKRREASHEVAAKPKKPSANSDVATTVSPDAPTKPVTVDDFIRAANGGMLPGEANAADTQGVSRPDETERIETDEATTQAAASVPAKTKPAADAKPTQRAVAKASAQLATRPAPPTAVLAAADTSAQTRLPAQQRIEGFGAEVAVVPGSAAPRSGLSRRNAPPDELAANDKALQRELTDEAMKPIVVPLYTRSGKLIVPAPMKGTHEVLVHQNLMADQEGLARIQDDDDLNRMRAAHLLLPLPDIESLEVNPELPYNRRCARPWTVKFVSDIAHAYYAKFHDPLRLSSAVRTVDFQRKLQRVNGNAAPIEGDTASPHLTGQAIDFAKGGMTRAEIAWMRAYLGPIMGAGKIDVEEEFQQACFHISVYVGYAPKTKSLRQEVSEVR